MENEINVVQIIVMSPSDKNEINKYEADFFFLILITNRNFIFLSKYFSKLLAF